MRYDTSTLKQDFPQFESVPEEVLVPLIHNPVSDFLEQLSEEVRAAGATDYWSERKEGSDLQAVAVFDGKLVHINPVRQNISRVDHQGLKPYAGVIFKGYVPGCEAMLSRFRIFLRSRAIEDWMQEAKEHFLGRYIVSQEMLDFYGIQLPAAAESV